MPLAIPMEEKELLSSEGPAGWWEPGWCMLLKRWIKLSKALCAASVLQEGLCHLAAGCSSGGV